MKNTLRKMINVVLTFLVGGSILGCAVDYGPMPLYAPPAPDSKPYLVVEGQVVDEVGRPLANICVDLKTSLLGEYVSKLYTDEQGMFGLTDYYAHDLEHDTLQLYFSDVYQIYAPDSIAVPFADMEKDTVDTNLYGCKCNVSMQLTKKEQLTEE